MRGRFSVLVMDHDQEILRSLHNLLLASDYDVHLACDGCAALSLLDRQRIDAAVIDLMTPRLDGFGVVRVILGKPERRRPRVIFVIAQQLELRSPYGSLRVRRVLPELFDAQELVKELGRELGAPHRQTGT